MAGRESGALAREFARLTAVLDVESLATSSVPLSYEVVCVRQLGESACIPIQANVVASNGDFACTDDQSDELEAVFERAFPLDSNDASAADAALIRRLRGMREQLKADLSQAECSEV